MKGSLIQWMHNINQCKVLLMKRQSADTLGVYQNDYNQRSKRMDAQQIDELLMPLYTTHYR